jgi:hypothetical protein
MEVPPTEEELERILAGEEDEAEEAEEETVDADADYDSLTVPELKELLKAQGLPVSGKKADLIERLASASGDEAE